MGLWSILRAIGIRFGENLDAQKARDMTMGLVEELLKSPNVKAGHPTADGKGFVPWALSPAAALERVEAEWDSPGRAPTIGEIVWFTAK